MKKERKIVYLSALGVLVVFILVLEIFVMARAIKGVDSLSAGQDPADSAQGDSSAEGEAVITPAVEGERTVLLFGGDINLFDQGSVMKKLAQTEEGISGCVSQALLSEMNAADLFCVNPEFAFTEGGTPLADKAYTYASRPENISILQAMGVDLVTLANDHIYDYGETGLIDTLATLDEAKIAHAGAGLDSAQAAEPACLQAGGKTIAYVNATQAEQLAQTPEAGEGSAGVFACYDTAALTQAVQAAKAQADYVVCCVHWGLEYNDQVSASQRTTAQSCIEAGADLVVGTHPHCLQGIEYYQGKPVFYSLGSLLFSGKTMDTCLLEIIFPEESEEGMAVLLPAVQEGGAISAAEEEQRQRIFQRLEELSPGVEISNEGLVSPGGSQTESQEQE